MGTASRPQGAKAGRQHGERLLRRALHAVGLGPRETWQETIRRACGASHTPRRSSSSTRSSRVSSRARLPHEGQAHRVVRRERRLPAREYWDQQWVQTLDLPLAGRRGRAVGQPSQGQARRDRRRSSSRRRSSRRVGRRDPGRVEDDRRPPPEHGLGRRLALAFRRRREFAIGRRLSSRAALETGWFVESLLTQTLIIHVIRTNKIPFLQSCASWPLIADFGHDHADWGPHSRFHQLACGWGAVRCPRSPGHYC